MDKHGVAASPGAQAIQHIEWRFACRVDGCVMVRLSLAATGMAAIRRGIGAYRQGQDKERCDQSSLANDAVENIDLRIVA